MFWYWALMGYAVAISLLAIYANWIRPLKRLDTD